MCFILHDWISLGGIYILDYLQFTSGLTFSRYETKMCKRCGRHQYADPRSFWEDCMVVKLTRDYATIKAGMYLAEKMPSYPIGKLTPVKNVDWKKTKITYVGRSN